MTRIINSVITLLWLTATCFIGYLAYIVTQTERNPQTLWGWLFLCSLTFISASWLTYNILYTRTRQ